MMLIDVLTSSWTGLVELFKNNPVPAVLVTLASVGMTAWNNQKNRAATIFGHSMQAVIHLDQRWESNELRTCRCQSATYLLESVDGTALAGAADRLEQRDALVAILNFLETVGSFTRSEAIGSRTAWNLFGSAVQIYCEAGVSAIHSLAAGHKTIYSELTYLYRVTRVEEERLDLPCAWFWRRIAAIRLTWRATGNSRWSWLNYLYAFGAGKIWSTRQLPPLFSRSDLIDHFNRVQRLGLAQPSKLPDRDKELSPIWLALAAAATVAAAGVALKRGRSKARKSPLNLTPGSALASFTE